MQAACHLGNDRSNIPKFVGESKDLESLCCNSSNLIVYSLLFWSVEERLESFLELEWSLVIYIRQKMGLKYDTLFTIFIPVSL